MTKLRVVGSKIIIPGSVSESFTRFVKGRCTIGESNCSVFPVFRYAKRGFCRTALRTCVGTEGAEGLT